MLRWHPEFPWLVHCGSGSRSSLCLHEGKENGDRLQSPTQTLDGSEEFMRSKYPSLRCFIMLAAFQTTKQTNKSQFQPQASTLYPRPRTSPSVTPGTLLAIGSDPSLLHSIFHPRARTTLLKAELWPSLPQAKNTAKLSACRLITPLLEVAGAHGQLESKQTQ